MEAVAQQQQAASLQGQALQEQESALSLLRSLEAQVLNLHSAAPAAAAEGTAAAPNGAGDGSGLGASGLLPAKIEATIRSIISTQESAGRLLVQASQARGRRRRTSKRVLPSYGPSRSCRWVWDSVFQRQNMSTTSVDMLMARSSGPPCRLEASPVRRSSGSVCARCEMLSPPN